MADQKISQLADAGAPQDTDQLLTARSGTTLSLLWSSIKTALGSLYVPLTRTITAGTGLTGGGDLSANRSFAVSYGTSATTACVGNDSRLSDSRTPTGAAGGDLTGTYPNPTLGTAGPGATGPIGDATHSPAVTIDAKGRVTALSSVAITGTAPGGNAGGDLAGTYPSPTVGDVSLLTTKGDILIRDTSAPAKRLAIGSTGQMLGIASGLPSWAYPPGYEISYTQITSSVNVASTTESSGTTIISPGAITFDGSPVICEFYGLVVSPNTTSASTSICLFEGATEITRLGVVFVGSSSGNNQVEIGLHARYRFTPTAASHTYTITAFASSTTGTPKIEAGSGGTAGLPPAYVRFTKV